MAVKYSLMVSTSVCTLKTLTSVLPLCLPLLRGLFEVSWGKEEVLLCPTSLEELLAQTLLERR